VKRRKIGVSEYMAGEWGNKNDNTGEWQRGKERLG